MSQIIKTFLSVFLILFMTVTGVGLLSAYMQVMNAQDMQARIVDEMENSNYASAVAGRCYEEATQAGYELTIVFYYDNGGTVSCSSAANLPGDVSDVTMAKVELTFPFEVKFLGIHKKHVFSGYAK